MNLKTPDFLRTRVKRRVTWQFLMLIFLSSKTLASGLPEYELRSDVFSAMVSMSPIVPENSVLLMGDSRKGSVDSSRLGFISTSAIVSRVISY